MSELTFRKSLSCQVSKKPMQIREILHTKELICSSSSVAEIIKYLEVYTFKNDKSLNSIVSEVLKCKRKTDEKIKILLSLLSIGYQKEKVSDFKSFLTYNFFHIIRLGDLDLLRLFLNYSINIKVKDDQNRNALFYLLESNNDNDEIIELLVKKGVPIEEKDKKEGQTALTLSAKKMMWKCFKALVNLGANVNHRDDKNGYTALHYLLLYRKEEMISFLLSRNDLDLTIKNKEGLNPVDLAVKDNLWKIYENLATEYKKREEVKEKELIELQKKLVEKGENKIHNSSSSLGELNISNGNDKNTNNNVIKNNYQSNNLQNINININNNTFSPRRGKRRNSRKFEISYSNKINLYSSDTILSIPFPLYQSPQNRPNYVLQPFLHIDISEEIKERNQNLEKDKFVRKEDLYYENKALNEELIRLKKELKLKEESSSRIEEDYQMKLKESKKIIDELTQTVSLIKCKNEELIKENTELKSYKKEEFSKISIDYSKNKKEYLDKKFIISKYDYNYVCKSLQKDLLDYQEYNKDQIKRLKFKQEELFDLVSEAVNESIPDYELKIYGSHATNLCLPWSDLDLVLVPKNNNSYIASNNNQSLQLLYYCLLEKHWQKSVKLIDTAIIPIIKMTSIDDFNNIQIDLSIQDSKHYGIKCVELVKSFLKEYDVLEPMVFALKNILKNANLNDPYTGGLSSYGLILLIVSFLQREIEHNTSIKISELGSLFAKFVYYFGCDFDQNNTVVYAYIPGEQGPLEREAINNYYNTLQPNHDLIIVDPLNKSNNVAKSTYHFWKIKMAFMISYIVSHEECECSCHYDKSNNETVTSIDHCLLKRIFTSIKRFNS